MTERKHFKRRVRARMTKTGESYTSARQQVVRQAAPADDLSAEYVKQTTGMTNEAVAKKTGRTWNQWVGLLDAARATRMGHQTMAAYLHEKEKLDGWWAQTVTVGYERIRGLRAINEKADGFAVNKSKTIEVPISRLYESWADESRRRLWLEEDQFEITTATRDKSLRIKWGDGHSRVDVYFYVKGDQKSQVTIQHSKLENQPEVERYREFWGNRLQQLQQTLKG